MKENNNNLLIDSKDFNPDKAKFLKYIDLFLPLLLEKHDYINMYVWKSLFFYFLWKKKQKKKKPLEILHRIVPSFL